MRYGISVPNFGPYADVRMLAELAAEAESAGWDGFFLWDHIQFWRGFDAPLVDPWVALAAIALATSRIRLGPMVTPLPRRRPWKLARESVSLDRLSGGRLILGVGIGFPADAEFEQFGEPGGDRERADILDEGLDLLTALWSGEEVDYQGRHYRVEGAIFQPTPVQSPRIPIWVGGFWPNRRPFRRAARWDGVFPAGAEEPVSLEEMREIIAYVRRHRTSAGPYDYVLSGGTSGSSADLVADRARLAACAEAGVTWWLESQDPLRPDAGAIRRRIQLGPPQL